MSTKSKTKIETEAFNGTPYDSVIGASKEQVEKALKASTEALESAMAAGKDQVDAIVSAGNVAAKGIETINAEVIAFSKTAIEEQISAAKALMGAKTLQEFIELQNDYAKSAFEAYTAHTTKLSEVATKVTQETFAPINAQFQAAVEKMVKPLAA